MQPRRPFCSLNGDSPTCTRRRDMSLNFRRLSPAISIGLLTISVVVAAQTPAPERSRTQGLKETDQFVKAGENMSEQVGDGKMQGQKTLDAYNALVTQP